MFSVHIRHVIFFLNIFCTKTIGDPINITTMKEGSIYGDRMIREELITRDGHTKIILAGIMIKNRYIITLGSYQNLYMESRLNGHTRLLLGMSSRVVISGESSMFDVIQHDNYAPDIGIIQIANKLALRGNVPNVNIPTQEHLNEKLCVAVTWDKNETRNVLYEYTVHVFNHQKCLEVYPDKYTGTICFTMAGDNDQPCKLIPGSPIICEGNLISIVAADINCGKHSTIAPLRVSAGIYYAKEWIRSTVQNRERSYIRHAVELTSNAYCNFCNVLLLWVLFWFTNIMHL